MPLAPRAITAVLRFSSRPARLVKFYRDVVGVPLEALRTPGFPAHHGCEVGNVYFAIVKSKASGGGACVAFLVDDVAVASRALSQAGVRQVQAPRRTAMGLISRFLDPDGAPFELYQP